MSISSINRPPTPPVETQQAAETAKVGAHNDRSVSQSAEQSASVHSSLSANIPQSNLRNRSARRPTGDERRGLFNTLRLCFGRRQHQDNLQVSSPSSQISSPTNTANTEANTMAMVRGRAEGLIQSSQSGIAAARGNVVTGLAEEKSSNEVESFLKSGDKGIRRGTTAIYNLGRMISFENLSVEEKQKMPAESLETLEKQSTQVKEMAKTVSNAKFLDGTRDFFQSGTTKDNGYSAMMEMHPEQDQAMRTWIRNGLNLGSELISAQDQIMLGGRVQSEDYMSDLQSRVNVFASIEQDAFAPLESNKSEMEGFAAEVLNTQV